MGITVVYFAVRVVFLHKIMLSFCNLVVKMDINYCTVAYY